MRSLLLLFISVLSIFLSCDYFLTSCASKTTNEIHESSSCGSGFMLISTIDGYLTSIDARTGMEKWRIKEGPVLESPLSVQKDFTFIPNPRDGQIYLVVERRLTKLPYTIPELVKVSPCRSSDGILYAGNKKDAWISIDPESGEKRTVLGPEINNFCPASDRRGIFIGRTEYHISLVDSKRERQWNATFVDYSSHLLPTETNYPFRHFTSSADGRILTVDSASGKILWRRNFSNIIVNIYLLKDDGMHKLPSTPIGKETFDRLDKSMDDRMMTSSLVDLEASEDFANLMNNLYPTLFIGESSDTGLYGIPTLIDQQTARISSKYIGPPLIEGPNAHKAKEEQQTTVSPLAIINPHGATYISENGEYLLLGYHEPPDSLSSHLVSKTIPSNILAFHHNRYELQLPFIEYIDDKRVDTDFDEAVDVNRYCVGNKCFYYRSKKPNTNVKHISHDKKLLIESGSDFDDDLSTEYILLHLWKKHPYFLMGTVSVVFALVIITVWLCAKHNTIMNLAQTNMRTISVSDNDVSSKSSKTSGKSSRWSLFTAYDDNDGADGGIHWVKVNEQLSFNSNDPLGSGCDGTIVYRGRFQNREVAVKRIIARNCELIDREINHMRESDSHANVIRYFCSASDRNFQYLALELCDCNLEEFIRQKQADFPKLEQLSILKQVTDGISYLHSINIVHRDVKPKNILLARQKNIVRILISDFGLCKTIADGRNSISKQSGFVGTKGWAAPETMNAQERSLSYAIDIFSLGCVFYYVLSDGHHPFGEDDLLSRELNISRGDYDLSRIDDNLYMELNLIEGMIEQQPNRRPTSGSIAAHPLFWSKERQLQFLMDVSDRIENIDPKTPPVERLERNSNRIVGQDGWMTKLSALQEDLRSRRSYRGNSIRDLLRAMRNKKHHYMELSPELKNSLGSPPDAFLTYFTSKFPKLLLHTFLAMTCFAEESIFKSYYPTEIKSLAERMWDDALKQVHPQFRTPPRIPTNGASNLVKSSLNADFHQANLNSFSPYTTDNFGEQQKSPMTTLGKKNKYNKRKKRGFSALLSNQDIDEETNDKNEER